MKSGKAITLVEILVVVVILMLLIGLIAPVIAGAKESAKRASCISQLRQLGLASFAYMEDSGGPPMTFGVEFTLLPNVLNDKRLLSCPSDPLKGMGTIEYRCRSHAATDGNSYYTPFEPGGRFMKWLQSVDGNPGIFACRAHGRQAEVSSALSEICDRLPFLFEGTTLRLRLDGSVEVFSMSLDPIHQGENKHFSYWHLFTDKAKPEVWEE